MRAPPSLRDGEDPPRGIQEALNLAVCPRERTTATRKDRRKALRRRLTPRPPGACSRRGTRAEQISIGLRSGNSRSASRLRLHAEPCSSRQVQFGKRLGRERRERVVRELRR